MRPEPLTEGEHLTRDEFERRYAPPTVADKSDLIDGVVRLRFPVRPFHRHGAGLELCWFFGMYQVGTQGVSTGAHSTIRLSATTDAHPGVCMIVRPEFGGVVRLDAEGVLEGPADLFADGVADESEDHRRVFFRCGVSECVRWNVFRNVIDWSVNQDGRSVRLPPDPADGLLKSRRFPGLWLDPAALARGDNLAVLAALQRGLATPEHAAFVQTLAAARR